ncbi:hypothetical protein CFHF_06330 [Caulobacter flavus]|uniref:Uncharacterized protein n=1 Tax=Caulobacter flavus TaxID=1679497 RepID=A0A2N5CX25_9CAUL|nr:hypothetical protein C1707_15330 [Caulobacter flavus]PLR18362.1 hypothetical protein CFHF_06330 [Caulobacter flavus]
MDERLPPISAPGLLLTTAMPAMIRMARTRSMIQVVRVWLGLRALAGVSGSFFGVTMLLSCLPSALDQL